LSFPPLNFNICPMITNPMGQDNIVRIELAAVDPALQMLKCREIARWATVLRPGGQ
jgi:hypothetical protein